MLESLWSGMSWPVSWKMRLVTFVVLVSVAQIELHSAYSELDCRVNKRNLLPGRIPRGDVGSSLLC